MLWIIIPLLLAVPGFAVNDDVGMRNRASGGSTGNPSHHLIFINVIYGIGLRALYTIVPDLPWYSLTFYAVQAVSVAAVVYVTVRVHRIIGLSAAVLMVGWLAYAVPRHTVSLTFTSTAILAAGAGVLLLSYALSTTARPLAIVVALALIFLASLIRANGLLLVLLAFAIPLVRSLRIAPRRTAAAILVALIAIPVGTHLFDDWFTDRGQAWAEFNEFNSYRGRLHATSRLDYGPHLDPVLSEIGWTPVELSLFAGFAYADPDVYTTDAVRKLYEATTARQPGQSVATDLRRVWHSHLLPIVAAAFVLSWRAVGNVRRRRPGQLAWLAASAVGVVAPMVYLALYVRFPTRVASPLWALPPVFLLCEPLFAGWTPTNPDRLNPSTGARGRTVGLVLTIAGALSLVGLGAAQVSALSERNGTRRAVLEESLDIIAGVDPDGVFVIRGSDLVSEGANPFVANTRSADRPDLLSLGWGIFSPPWNERRADLGLNRVFADIVGDPHVYLVSTEIRAQQIADFAWLRYGIAGSPYPVAKLPNDKMPGIRGEVRVYVWAYSNPAQ